MKYIKYIAASVAIISVYLFVFSFGPHRPVHTRYWVVVVPGEQFRPELFPTNGYEFYPARESVPWTRVYKSAAACSHEELRTIKQALAVNCLVQKVFGSGNMAEALVYTNWDFRRLEKLVAYGSASNLVYIDALPDPSTKLLLLSPALLQSHLRTSVALYQQGRRLVLASTGSPEDPAGGTNIERKVLSDTIRFTEQLEDYLDETLRGTDGLEIWVQDIIEIRQRMTNELFRTYHQKWIPGPKRDPFNPQRSQNLTI